MPDVLPLQIDQTAGEKVEPTKEEADELLYGHVGGLRITARNSVLSVVQAATTAKDTAQASEQLANMIPDNDAQIARSKEVTRVLNNLVRDAQAALTKLDDIR